ncbi:MAG: hypothetical protein QXG00_06075, partial [Candidatus Woesearchaeota archaeon]
MLSWNEVLNYVKRSLGFPYHFLEYTDEEIVKDLKSSCLRKFSTYFPDKRTMALDCSDEKLRVPNKQDCFYLIEP